MTPLDILYTPLDVAPVPHFDVDKFLIWCKDNGPVQDIYNRKDASQKTDSKIYPWNIAYAKSAGKWHNDFCDQFPKLAKYFSEAFGLTEQDVGEIVLLPVKQGFSGLGFWHADPDEHGLRFYLANEDTEDSLLIRPTKEPHTERPKTVVNKVEPSPHVQDVEYVAKIISPQQAFFLNNVRAIHAVKTNKPDALRIAVIIGGLGPIANMRLTLQELIVRSAEKYSDAAILWAPEK